jgi:putative endonuclease
MDTYYNYVLRSLKDKNYYIGYTANLKKRLKDHKEGEVKSTRYRRPFTLVYCEISFDKESAIHREKYLKTTYGHRYLNNRIGSCAEGYPI